ncbi:Putative pyridoxal phosphate-dependent aminotransferase EpsN [Mariniblastus fucicola]|uniref:Pyridoxal phosphate-dependent aminotransferase EpsN n=2 Tax=Mariniblastus fucicola TaxID=980251 RepID=A0A5B9PI75_9BACT|nr:Putative pyridoxal phosphate-dependent aminotransferase EpsN [Mariniblastus fucicola]
MCGRELDYVKKAFESNYIAPVGPQLDQFEELFSEITGLPHCVAVANGTSAIHLMLRCIGIKPGDLVLASTLTFIGSVAGAKYLGADLGFIDCDYDTWNMDIDVLEKEIESLLKSGIKPAAVLPTENYGQPCDVDRLRSVCDRYEIPLVMDCAETVGATYKGQHVGHGVKAAAFSFNGNKIVTTSGGGMVTSDDGALIDHARYLANQAKQPGWQYEHHEIGYNYRLSNILAAIGISQLEVIEQRVQRKREIFNQYKDELAEVPGIRFMPDVSYGVGNRWLTAVMIDEKEFGVDNIAVMTGLEAENIESRPIWRPLHTQKVFANCRVAGGQVAESINRQGICLPSGTSMSNEDVTRICKTIRSLCKTRSLRETG